MARDLVPVPRDLADDPGRAVGLPANDEERRAGPGVGQELEQPRETGLECGGEGAPLVQVEIQALVPVLDVDGEDVAQRGHVGCAASAMPRRARRRW